MQQARSVLTLLALMITAGCGGAKGGTDTDIDANLSSDTSDSSTPATTTSGTSGATPTSGTPTSTGLETTGADSTTGAPLNPCEGDTPRVRLVTSMGDMVVMLDAVNAPITVANFIHYVETDFYAGTIFHRVLDGFVIQGGGFTTDMQQKPTDPPIPLEIVPGLTHIDGAIAMARTNVPDSATSQFYICDGPQHGLDDQYAVFGVLVEGADVRDAISAVMVVGDGVPVEDVIIMSATCE